MPTIDRPDGGSRDDRDPTPSEPDPDRDEDDEPAEDKPAEEVPLPACEPVETASAEETTFVDVKGPDGTSLDVTVRSAGIDRARRVLVAGMYEANSQSREGAVFVTRLTESGEADTSFGKHGSVVLEKSRGSSGMAYWDHPQYAVRADAQNRVLVLYVHSTDSGQVELRITRLSTDGAVDAGFGSAGHLVLATMPKVPDEAALGVRGNTAWVAWADEPEHGAPEERVHAVRVTATGALDPAFSADFTVPNQYRMLHVAASEDRLSIVNSGLLTRLDASTGARDESFGQAGVVACPDGFGLLSSGEAVCGNDLISVDGTATPFTTPELLSWHYTELCDGRIVAAAHYYAALLTNGQLDPSRGTEGDGQVWPTHKHWGDYIGRGGAFVVDPSTATTTFLLSSPTHALMVSRVHP